jgi:DNA repair exonuclease SbcCD nuclease subunit
MNDPIFVVGDIHLDEVSAEECYDIAYEIVKIKRDRIDGPCDILFLGDICDKNKLNAVELDKLLGFFQIFKSTFRELIIIKGNHDQYDSDSSIVDFLNYFDIQIEADEFVYNDCLFGHFFTDKSTSAFGRYRYKIEDLKKKYKYTLLGHQHDFQQLAENIYHVGSIRFIDFGERPDIKKRIAILTDKIEFVELTYTMPIYDVCMITELEALPDKAKVRYIFKSLTQLKEEIDIIQKLSTRFFQFKTKNAFLTAPAVETNDRLDYKKFIFEWLKTIQDKDVNQLLTDSILSEIAHVH